MNKLLLQLLNRSKYPFAKFEDNKAKRARMYRQASRRDRWQEAIIVWVLGFMAVLALVAMAIFWFSW